MIADDEARAGEADAMRLVYARTLYTLRESRKAMLAPYAAADEASLLEQIGRGDIAPHPAYDHYLGALIIGQARDAVRAELMQQGDGAATLVHAMLREQADAHYAHRLSEPVRLAQDALLMFFDTGLMVEARYFSADEYAIAWCWGEAELRIDTAPVHPDCASFPHHLHDDSGRVRADTVTRPGTPCWSNFSRLIDALLLDPLLEREQEDTQQASIGSGSQGLAVAAPRQAVLLTSERKS